MFLTKRQVSDLTGYCDQQIRLFVRDGLFPKPVCLNPDPNACGARKAWLKSEVDEWIAGRIAARDAGEVNSRDPEIVKRFTPACDRT